ncbi:GSCOCG00010390001-RA-CDS [Cotesia congregata]|nr:GSCOCG00010390001-RA-CDS [Cotesia congregata]
MDFGKLLTVAQKNSSVKQVSNGNVSYYPTKFTPPKKETKQSKNLTEGIKKFLARKEEEERQKLLEEKRKKENLLSMRDQKVQNKINKHLKVSKAANKSVLLDAVNHKDTAITLAGNYLYLFMYNINLWCWELVFTVYWKYLFDVYVKFSQRFIGFPTSSGPSQPDEDDYGYVSQEASAFYDKLMNKYQSLPSEKPWFSDSGKKVVKDIASTKDRVKQALKQQELEASLPHRRKRKSEASRDDRESQDSSNERDNHNHSSNNSNTEEEKPKPKKRPLPPPIDFMSLLKIAEQKQHEPIVIEPKPKPKEEVERPMTKKQRIEYQKEKEYWDRRERQKNGDYKPSPSSSAEKDKSSVKSSTSSTGKIPKVNGAKVPSVKNDRPPEKEKTDKTPVKLAPSPKKIPDKKVSEKSSSSKPNLDLDVEEAERKINAEIRKLENAKRALKEQQERNLKKKAEERDNNTSVNKSNGVNKNNGNNLKNSSFPPADVKPRQFPPADVKPRQFPPPDVRPRQFPPPDVRKNGSKLQVNKRRILDDEEEYDSELDDFIDDDPHDGSEDYSKYISEIFGYDKSKYANFDDEDDNMESNYAQQLREEFVSTKIGIMEDLEDIRQENLEKKRKAMMMKKTRKK